MSSKKTDLMPVTADGLIHIVRGQRILLDSDLAGLYGVPTRVLNQAVARNRKRFPTDFAYRLTAQEVKNLKSQIVTSSFNHGGRRKLPWAFTEQGVAMLSSVLRSPMAIKVNIEIMRAFVRLRQLLATPGELVTQVQQMAAALKLHDDQIQELFAVLEQMLAPPPEPTRGRFGFHPPDTSEQKS